ncbi:MAG: FAD binding domain-containing protein [Chloroflexota bacterium]|nr:FAD binding domain-containing protein [Chloroflexota bacterium]
MKLWQEFRQPTTITEAIEVLTTAPQPAMPIAGGSDLLLDIRQGRLAPVHTLVDLKSVPEMNVIEQRGQELFIGASISITNIIQNELTLKNARALVEACNLIAGPQVRNTATLGGNVAHALPAADGTIAMLALNAHAEVASKAGLRRMLFQDLFLGPGNSAIDKTCELITGFYLMLANRGQASCFKRIMRPQGVALPILNCAVWVCRDVDTVIDVRISVGPGGPVPFRATEAEAILKGRPLDQDQINKALEKLLSQANFRTSPLRATASYRQHLIKTLFKDTLTEAWIRAA